MYFQPARLWLDTDGNPIQAHGGGILFDEKSETYYWYGENKDGETYRAHKKGAARVSGNFTFALLHFHIVSMLSYFIMITSLTDI